MKAARCILKAAALVAVLGAAVCVVAAYWDKIVDAFYALADKVEEKKANCFCSSEYDDPGRQAGDFCPSEKAKAFSDG